MTDFRTAPIGSFGQLSLSARARLPDPRSYFPSIPSSVSGESRTLRSPKVTGNPLVTKVRGTQDLGENGPAAISPS